MGRNAAGCHFWQQTSEPRQLCMVQDTGYLLVVQSPAATSAFRIAIDSAVAYAVATTSTATKSISHSPSAPAPPACPMSTCPAHAQPNQCRRAFVSSVHNLGCQHDADGAMLTGLRGCAAVERFIVSIKFKLSMCRRCKQSWCRGAACSTASPLSQCSPDSGCPHCSLVAHCIDGASALRSAAAP